MLDECLALMPSSVHWIGRQESSDLATEVKVSMKATESAVSLLLYSRLDDLRELTIGKSRLLEQIIEVNPRVLRHFFLLLIFHIHIWDLYFYPEGCILWVVLFNQSLHPSHTFLDKKFFL
jgi:hypothetical protein